MFLFFFLFLFRVKSLILTRRTWTLVRGGRTSVDCGGVPCHITFTPNERKLSVSVANQSGSPASLRTLGFL